MKGLFAFFTLVASEDLVVPNNFRRLWRLGQAYNSQADRIIFENAIGAKPGWDNIENLQVSKRVESLDYEFKSVTKFDESLSVLDISANAALGAMKGQIKGTISGAYTNAEKDYESRSEILVKLKFVSKVTGLDMRGIQRIGRAREMAYDANIKATHFVKEITYGGELLASLSFVKNETMERQIVDASASVRIEDGMTGGAAAGAVRGRLNFDDALTENAEDLKIQIWGLPSPIGSPQTKEEFDAFLEEYVDFMKVFNNGHGVPILITMGDIRDVFVNEPGDVLYEQAGDAIVTNVISYINDLKVTLAQYPEKTTKIDIYTEHSKTTSAMDLAATLVKKANICMNEIFDVVVNMDGSRVNENGENVPTTNPATNLEAAENKFNEVGEDFPCLSGLGRFNKQIQDTIFQIEQCDINPITKTSSFCNHNGVCKVERDTDAVANKLDENGNLVESSCLRAKTTCQCMPGWSGERCNIHTCELNQGDGPCQNEPFKCERVMQEETGYRCDCRHPFHGDNCEHGYCEMFAAQMTNGNAIEPNLCQNGGTCLNTLEYPYFTCQCAPGNYGNRCEQNVCDGDRCNGHGTCTSAATAENPSAFTCDCNVGYSGDTCEIAACSIENGSCLNNAKCAMDSNDEEKGYRCDCRAPYEGKYCGFHYGCTGRYAKCMNHGVCQEKMEAPYFECACAGGYYGTFCQTHFCDSAGSRGEYYRDQRVCGAAGKCIEMAEVTDEQLEDYFLTYKNITVDFVDGEVCNFDYAVAFAHAHGRPIPTEDNYECGTNYRQQNTNTVVEQTDETGPSFLPTNEDINVNEFVDYYEGADEEIDLSNYYDSAEENSFDTDSFLNSLGKKKRRRRSTLTPAQSAALEMYGPQRVDWLAEQDAAEDQALGWNRPITEFSAPQTFTPGSENTNTAPEVEDTETDYTEQRGVDYECECLPGWNMNDNNQCRVSVCDTDRNPCGVRGECKASLVDARGYTCVCYANFFHGVESNCEHHICDSDVNPCGPGTCNELDTGGYTCDCTGAAGWMGNNCERHICQSDQFACKNGGICAPSRFSHTGYTCRCPNGIDEDIESCRIGELGTPAHDLLNHMSHLSSSQEQSDTEGSRKKRALAPPVGGEQLIHDLEEQMDDLVNMFQDTNFQSETCNVVNLNINADYKKNGVTRTADECQGSLGWRHVERFGSYYLEIPKIVSTYEKARQVCNSHNAEVVSIGSAEEYRWLKSITRHKSFWIGLTSANVKASHVTFDDKCKLLSPSSFNIVGYRSNKCYGISGDEGINAYDCDGAFHHTFCKKAFDTSKACKRDSEMVRCAGSNLLTDGREETSTKVDGTYFEVPENIVHSRYHEFTVVIKGNTEVDVTVEAGAGKQWARCFSVEKTSNRESFVCHSASVEGRIKIQGNRLASEVEIMGCPEERADDE